MQNFRPYKASSHSNVKVLLGLESKAPACLGCSAQAFTGGSQSVRDQIWRGMPRNSLAAREELNAYASPAHPEIAIAIRKFTFQHGKLCENPIIP